MKKQTKDASSKKYDTFVKDEATINDLYITNINTKKIDFEKESANADRLKRLLNKKPKPIKSAEPRIEPQKIKTVKGIEAKNIPPKKKLSRGGLFFRLGQIVKNVVSSFKG
ncbi:MAG: hypothetical protein HQL29_05060 [Candidatus Omnitrophica bacterium]|nr:hypothetical protein [Candidatus Omnitrophota bacterium]